jgi:hypothetical protein
MDEQTSQEKSNIPDQVPNINCEELILTPNKIQKELNDQNSILQYYDDCRIHNECIKTIKGGLKPTLIAYG